MNQSAHLLTDQSVAQVGPFQYRLQRDPRPHLGPVRQAALGRRGDRGRARRVTNPALRRRPARGRHPTEERELRRLRRGETALALVATATPYIAAIAVIILVASAFLPDSVTAIGGSALVLIIVGFGAQRFLMDVIAGTLIGFERWYSVGDFVRIEPAQVAGIVEQFGLRTTVIRSLNGDRAYIPNSQIIAAVRSPGGYRRYTIEILTSDPEAARNAIDTVWRRSPVGEARFLRAPRVPSRSASSAKGRGSCAAAPMSLRPWSGWPRSCSWRG